MNFINELLLTADAMRSGSFPYFLFEFEFQQNYYTVCLANGIFITKKHPNRCFFRVVFKLNFHTFKGDFTVFVGQPSLQVGDIRLSDRRIG